MMVDSDEERRPDFRTLKSKMPEYNEIQTFLQSNPGHVTNYVDVSNTVEKKVLGHTDNFMGDLNTK